MGDLVVADLAVAHSHRKRTALIGGACALLVAALAGGSWTFRSCERSVPADGKPHLTVVWSRETSPTKVALHGLSAPSTTSGLPPIAVGDDGVVLMRGAAGTWE